MTDLDYLRKQVQRDRDTYYEQACEHGQRASQEEQEARAFGRVEAYDDVLALLAGTGCDDGQRAAIAAVLADAAQFDGVAEAALNTEPALEGGLTVTYARDPYDTDQPPCFCDQEAGPVLTTQEFCPAHGDPAKPAPEPPEGDHA